MSYEMILCIVNDGFSSAVMDAARAVGVSGGTIIHARGTAAKDAEEYFHITIQPEKDVVMMIVPSDLKDTVLHTLYRQVGLNTQGQGIAFSVPVDNVVGLTPAAKEKKPED